jgi:DNA-binding PucR family transcriptional regulator
LHSQVKDETVEEHTSVDKLNTAKKLEEENSLLKSKISEEEIQKMEDLKVQLQHTLGILLEKQKEIDNLQSEITIVKKRAQWEEIVELDDTIDELRKSEANIKLCLENSMMQIGILNAELSEKDYVIQRMITKTCTSVDSIKDIEESVNESAEIVKNTPAPQVKAGSEFKMDAAKET